MFKIKWSEMGAKLSRMFGSQKELETAVAGLRQAGIAVKEVIAPASVARVKPKSKPRVAGGRGTSIVGEDGREIKVGEKCFYRVRTYVDGVRSEEWKRGTLERVKLTSIGPCAWVAGKYLPWRMCSQAEIRALPVKKPEATKVDVSLERALELYPDRLEHHEARAAFRRAGVAA